MHLEEKISSRLIINGFTINPLKDPDVLNVVIMALCSDYDLIHTCDHRLDMLDEKGEALLHKNYLGKLIDKPLVSYVQNKSFQGLIGFAILENGYFTIKIWDNTYPAQVQFDLFLDEKMDDCDIILDHLSCPAGAFDGLGLFNPTYSLTNFTKNDIFVTKNNKQDSAYLINKPFDKEKYDKDPDYTFTLNEFTKNECHFCKLTAEYLIFHGYPRKVVAVCKSCNREGAGREHGANPNAFFDIRRKEENKIEKIVYEKNGESVTINYTKKNFDDK